MKPVLNPSQTLWLYMLAVGAVSVSFPPVVLQAQTVIVADPSAPKTQQPTVIRSNNNTVQVNIQAPSAAGVSRNTYQQFDVARDGAILNNSNANVQTQIGGWVQANPWLGNKAARVILNEVNSPNPSQLKGYIEVAGQRADVVIANPAGISVNGGGFINASRAYLTTGTAVVNAGNIDSFRVQSGTVSIDGQGLDTRTVDYTAILSRALELNAGVWANELKVVTGNNQIITSSLAPDTVPMVTAISSNVSKPLLAIDVSQLGGMYAGKIHLIGTESGLGVRNAGLIQANSGPLVLNQDGWLANSGSIQSSQNMQVATNGRVDNSGSLYASGNLSIQSKDTQTHSGTTAALGTLNLQAQGDTQTAIRSTNSAVIAAGIQADGQLVNARSLSVTADGQVQLKGKTMTTDALALKGDSVDVSQGILSANQASITALRGDVNATASQITVNQNLNIQTPQKLITDSANASTNTLDLQANAWSNVAGSLTHTGTRDLSIRLNGDFDNTRGVVRSNSDNLSMQASALNNQGGEISNAGTGTLSITTDALDNRFETGKTTGSSIASNGKLTLAIGNNLQNQGTVSSVSDMQITADSLNNSGVVYAGTDLNINTRTLNNQGSLVAQNNQSINTDTLTASDGSLIAAGMTSAGKLQANPNGTAKLGITGTGSLQSAGQLLAYDDVTLSGTSIDLQHSQTASQTGNLSLTATQGDINTSNAVINSPGNISISAIQHTGQGLINQSGNISADSLALELNKLDNSSGTIAQSGNTQLDIDLGSGSFDNTLGVLSTGGKLNLTSAHVTNTQGKMFAGAHLNLQTGTLNNGQGVIVSNGDLSVQAGLINNQQGTIGSQTGAVSISSSTGGLDNTKGLVQAATDLSLNAQGNGNSINSTEGQLIAKRNLSSNSGAFDNTRGLVSAQRQLSINTNGGRLTNSNTADAQHRYGLQAGGSANIQSGALDNDTGYINANGLTVAAASVDNRSGLAISNADSSLGSASLDNRSGQWLSVGNMDLKLNNLDNSSQGSIQSAGALSLQADNKFNNATGQFTSTGALNIGALNANTPTLSIDNSGGVIKSDGSMGIKAANLNGAGTIESGTQASASRAANGQANALAASNDMDMAIELQGDYTTQGTMSSAGNLNLKTTGKLINNKSVSAGNDLTVAAANIDNQVDGEFISGNNTSVTASNDFTNRGLVDGVHTQINSKTLTNLGTGRIYGDRISIAANTLTNKEETVGNTTTAATIASRNDLDIGAQTIVNQEHALIYSNGDMSMAGALDSNRRATGRANSVTNSSATMEAGNDLYLNSANTLNIDAHLQTGQQFSQYAITEDGNPRYDYTRSITEDKIVISDPAKIIAGRNMSLTEGVFKNQDSQVLAGGLLTKSGTSVENLERMGTKTTHDVGTMTRLHVWHCDFRILGKCVDSHHSDDAYAWQRAPVVETLNLTQSQYQSFSVLSQDQQNLTFTKKAIPITAPYSQSVSAVSANTNSASLQSATGNNPSTTPNLTAQRVNVSPVVEVRSASLPQSVPNTSLYKIRPAPASKYLVETDPQFTNQKTWLSSDYMLKSVALDPAMSQKRLGDGFFEQKLIREQVAQLTGRRFLGDYTNDDQQYQALMNNALTTAKTLNLRPGVALSPAQMALLTSDMVWLVEQSIALADGSKQTVLVPQLYVRVKPGDLDGSGSLIAGDSINMKLTGDLNNTGTIAGRKLINITADNIKNLGGTISADALNAVAKLDIDNTGGTIEALSSASLVAGRDFNMTTTTQSSATASGLSNFSQTGVGRVAALYVKNPGGALSIQAGRDINLTAAKIDSQGSASVVAGNNINLGTVTTERTNNLNFDANNYNRSSSSKDVGSSITSSGNMSLSAANDITAKAANVQAGGALNVNAGNDIIILAGEDKQSSSSASKSTSSGFFTSTTTTTQNSSASNKAIASTFSGQTTSIVADNNLISIGTEFKGADSLLVEGKNEQKIYAAIDQSSSFSRSESSSSFIGINIANSSNSQAQAQTTALGSKLISDKAIQVNVGKSVEFSGADITAPQTTFNNIDPNKPGMLTLGGATQTTQTTRSSSSETAGVWQSQSGGGSTTQTLKQTTINGDVKFDKDLQVAVQLPNVVNTNGKAPAQNTNTGTVTNVNQASVQSQIETLSQQPGLGYLKQLMDANAASNSAATNSNATNNTASSNTPSSTNAANTNAIGPKVQWSQVQLAHDNWNYSQQGLTPAGAALLSIAVAAYAPGLSTGVVSATGGGAVAAGLNAGLVALQAQAAVAMVNNGGDIGKTLQQLGSDQSVKSLLTTMVTAGALQAMNTAMADTSNASASTTVANGQSGGAASGVNGVATTQTANAFTQNLTRNLTNNLAGAVVDSAINNKPLNADTVANALKSSLITSGMASGANAIGDAAANGDINTFTQKVAHAVLGCVGGAATTGNSGGCSAGAVGAVVGEMAADYYMSNKQDPKLSAEQNKANALAFAKVVSAASGIVAGGGGDNVAAVNVANTTGTNAAENNYLTHNKLSNEEGELIRLKKQKAAAQCDTTCNTRIIELETIDKLRDEQLAPLIAACEKAGRNNCKGEAIAQNFAQTNGFGAESMKRESNAESSSPFSFNNCPTSDKGGCSYGPLQIAADTGMMNGFLEGLRKNPSDKAQIFYKELQAAGGVTASQNKDPAFIQTWMTLTAKDPQFVQYQIDALVNQNLYPVVQELQKIGIDFNTLPSSQKEAIFSAAVQHGAGTISKTKGADNIMERAISIAQTDVQAPSLPTYTRQELVYGQVEDQMRTAEESQAKLIKRRENLITQRENLITQRESLITQQLNLERQKSQLLEQGLGASSGEVKGIQTQVKTLDQKIRNITEQVAPITTKVNDLTNQVAAQEKYIQEAAQYLKSQAQGSFADGEQWLKDFYAQRTQMYPNEASRYKKELDSLLKQYREEQKSKPKK